MTEHKPIFLDRVKANVAAHHMRTPFGRVSDLDARTTDGMTLRAVLNKAVPFVIDDDAVVKALEVRQKFLLNPKVPLIDIALVPFSETWIEYDPRAKFPPGEVLPMTAQHTGHLIVRGEHGVSVMTFEGWHKEVMTMPYVVNWSLDPPAHDRQWFQVIGVTRRVVISDDATDVLRAMLLSGNPEWMPNWGRRVGGDLVNPDADTIDDAEKMSSKWATVFKEHRSVTSLLMSVLALIAWCPVEMTDKKPRGMFLHNRKPRPYMEHRLVHLRVPIRKVYAYIKKGAGVVARKRRHRVREHLRVYNAGTPREKRVVIHEHMRGDAALGYVTQEYEVST